MPQIYLAETAIAAEQINPAVTIKTKFGNEEVTGAKATFRKRNKNSQEKSSCLNTPHIRVKRGEKIAISMADLDTLGGVLSICNWPVKDKEGSLFWSIIDLIESEGIHNLNKIKHILLKIVLKKLTPNTNEYNIAKNNFNTDWEFYIKVIKAFNLWSSENPIPKSKNENKAINITGYLSIRRDILTRLFINDINDNEIRDLFKRSISN